MWIFGGALSIVYLQVSFAVSCQGRGKRLQTVIDASDNHGIGKIKICIVCVFVYVGDIVRTDSVVVKVVVVR